MKASRLLLCILAFVTFLQAGLTASARTPSKPNVIIVIPAADVGGTGLGGQESKYYKLANTAPCEKN